jgi:1-acyl-sn-glycerol-3-phosphate acyltransferase
MIYKLGHIRFLSASYAKTIPFFGRLIRIVDPIFIDRKKGRNNYTQQITDSLHNPKQKIPHVIFPEGSYENAQVLLRFKSGAFVAGVPITPVLFVYTKYIPYWNRQESSFPIQLYRYFTRIYTPVHMIILPIYEPNEEEKQNPKIYAENLRRYMSYHLKIPLSKFDIYDSPNFKKDIQ